MSKQKNFGSPPKKKLWKTLTNRAEVREKSKIPNPKAPQVSPTHNKGLEQKARTNTCQGFCGAEAETWQICHICFQKKCDFWAVFDVAPLLRSDFLLVKQQKNWGCWPENFACLSFQLPSKGRWKIAVTTQRFGQHLIEADLGSSQHPKKTWSIGCSQYKGKKTRPILEFYQFRRTTNKKGSDCPQQNLLTSLHQPDALWISWKVGAWNLVTKTSTKKSSKEKKHLSWSPQDPPFFSFWGKGEQTSWCRCVDILLTFFLRFFFVPSEAELGNPRSKMPLFFVRFHVFPRHSAPWIFHNRCDASHKKRCHVKVIEFFPHGSPMVMKIPMLFLSEILCGTVNSGSICTKWIVTKYYNYQILAATLQISNMKISFICLRQAPSMLELCVYTCFVYLHNI